MNPVFGYVVYTPLRVPMPTTLALTPTGPRRLVTDHQGVIVPWKFLAAEGYTVEKVKLQQVPGSKPYL